MQEVIKASAVVIKSASASSIIAQAGTGENKLSAQKIIEEVGDWKIIK